MLALLTGFRLLQVGAWGFDPELLQHAGTLCQWRLARWPCRDSDVGFDGANLPVASASIDALLLAHSLELTPQPHRLLRECERVLSDRGQLVLLGFNPLSMWGLAQRLPGRSQGRFVRSAQLYAAGRVCDWLRLLGLEPERLVRYGVGFPSFGHSMTVSPRAGGNRPVSLAWMAQAYLVFARKRVVPMNRLRWRDKKEARSKSREIGLAHPGARRVD